MNQNLKEAAAQLKKWQVQGTKVESLETANLLSLARVLVAAALERRESPGAHFRNDYPETIESQRHSLTFARKVPVAC